MSKIGDTKKEKIGDDTYVWRLIAIESEANMDVHRNRIALIEQEILTIEDFDEEAVAQSAILEERKMRKQMKEDMTAEMNKLKEKVGD